MPARCARLRATAKALRISWPAELDYPEFVRSLDPALPAHAAMLNACTMLFRGAGYQAFDGEVPLDAEHAALATDYAHCTAPLRRLVDRYVGEVCLALCAGTPVPAWVREALPALPAEMAAADRRAKKYERSVVDLVEVVLLAPRVGELFPATVVDVDEQRRHGTVVVADPAVEARVAGRGPAAGAGDPGPPGLRRPRERRRRLRARRLVLLTRRVRHRPGRKRSPRPGGRGLQAVPPQERQVVGPSSAPGRVRPGRRDGWGGARESSGVHSLAPLRRTLGSTNGWFKQPGCPLSDMSNTGHDERRRRARWPVLRALGGLRAPPVLPRPVPGARPSGRGAGPGSGRVGSRTRRGEGSGIAPGGQASCSRRVRAWARVIRCPSSLRMTSVTRAPLRRPTSVHCPSSG